jgi:putative PIN family toxin of toxin-antitoxin system
VPRAVLDANVYVSAAIRPQGPPGQILERFLRESAFDIVLSPAIVDEVMRALAYPKVRKLVSADIDPTTWFEAFILLADLIPGEHTVQGVSDDPDDDKYLAAAVEGRASFVVSGDPDLLAVKQHEGIRIVSPREFLDVLA